MVKLPLFVREQDGLTLFAALPVCDTAQAATLPAVSSSCPAALCRPRSAFCCASNGGSESRLSIYVFRSILLSAPYAKVCWTFGLTQNGWSYLSAACAVFLLL